MACQQKYDQSVNYSSVRMGDIISLLGNNLSNKNVASLSKCMEIIDQHTKRLQEKKKELTNKLNLLLKNTMEDIRKIRLEGNTKDMFEEEITMSMFEEKNSTKQKFRAYLDKAKIILDYKKELKEVSNTITEQLESVESQLREYTAVLENIKICMETLIIPEISRRREFDELNKMYTAFYWNWVTKETQSREKFFDHGDIDQLPYAFKKILMGFVYDDTFKVDERFVEKHAVSDFNALNKVMTGYFDRWAHSPDQNLKGKLEEYLTQYEKAQDQIAINQSEIATYVKQLENLKAELAAEGQKRAGLESENSKLSHEISSLRSQLNNSNSSDATAVRNLTTELTDLRNKMNEYINNAAKLQGDITSSTSVNENLKQELLKKENQNLELKLKISEISSEKIQNALLLENSKKEVEQKNTTIATLHDEAKSLRDQLAKQQNISSDKTSNYEKIIQELAFVKSRLADLQGKHDELLGAKSLLESDLREVINAKQVSDGLLATIKQEKQLIQENFDKEKAELKKKHSNAINESVNNMKTSLEKINKDHAAEIEALNSQIEKLKGGEENMQNMLELEKKQSQDYTSKIEALEDDYRTALEENKALNKALAELRKKEESYIISIEENNEHEKKVKAARADAEKAKQEIEQIKASFKAKIKDLQAQLSDAKSKAAAPAQTKSGSISNLHSKLAESAKVAALKTELAQSKLLTSTIINLPEKSNTQNSERDELTAHITKLAEENESLRTANKILNENAQALNKQQQEILSKSTVDNALSNKEKTIYQTKLSEMERINKELSSTLQKKFDESLSREKQTFQKKVDDIEAKMKKLEGVRDLVQKNQLGILATMFAKK